MASRERKCPECDEVLRAESTFRHLDEGGAVTVRAQCPKCCRRCTVSLGVAPGKGWGSVEARARKSALASFERVHARKHPRSSEKGFWETSRREVETAILPFRDIFDPPDRQPIRPVLTGLEGRRDERTRALAALLNTYRVAGVAIDDMGEGGWLDLHVCLVEPESAAERDSIETDAAEREGEL